MLLWLALLVPTCQAFSITHSYAARHAMMRHRMTENNGDNAGGADDDDSILLCPPIPTTPSSDSLATCVLAMGWFWGPQLQFSQLDGIVRTVVGYSGGSQENPCYHNILDSSEAILIEYDPQQLTYSDILNMVCSNKIWLVTFITIFEYHSHYICALQKTLIKWATKFAFFRSKPSKRQYRQILFINSEHEKDLARIKIRALEQTSPVYVSVEPATIFYRAEEHHQDFFIKSRAKIAESNRLNMMFRP